MCDLTELCYTHPPFSSNDPPVPILESAPNSAAWLLATNYLGATIPFPKQLEQITRFFEDVCYFCSDTHYVHNIPADANINTILDRVCFLHHGICPKCHLNRAEILAEWFKDPRYYKFNTHFHAERTATKPTVPNEFLGIWGQRSGKNITTAFILSYILHRALTTPNLPTYLQLPVSTVLEISIVGRNSTIYTILSAMFETSPWFSYFKDTMRSWECQVNARNSIVSTDFGYAFPYHRLLLHYQALNASLRDVIRLASTIEEACWEKPQIAEDTFTTLDNSLRTVRVKTENRWCTGDYNTLNGYMINLSSPCSKNDFLTQRAATSSQKIFFSRLPTWAINSYETKQNLIKECPDTERFLRDFGAETL